MVQEIWKQVKNWPSYEVSNLGNVRSKERVEVFKNTTRKRSGCSLKKRIIRKYYCVMLKDYKRATTAYVHRLVAEAFISNPENKKVVNHIDKNKLNNNADNLEWVTQKENIHHAMMYNDWTRGENHGHSKLTESDIVKIRSYDKSYMFLAKQYNISYTTVKRIRNKTAWKHVTT